MERHQFNVTNYVFINTQRDNFRCLYIWNRNSQNLCWFEPVWYTSKFADVAFNNSIEIVMTTRLFANNNIATSHKWTRISCAITWRHFGLKNILSQWNWFDSVSQVHCWFNQFAPATNKKIEFHVENRIPFCKEPECIRWLKHIHLINHLHWIRILWIILEYYHKTWTFSDWVLRIIKTYTRKRRYA